MRSGRPHKSFERINRIFGQCLAKLDDHTLSDAEKQQRELFIAFCLRVCAMSASQPPRQEGTNDER